MQMKQTLPTISQFLNRLLSLKIDDQAKVFTAFSDRLDNRLRLAALNNTLDRGLETVVADHVVKLSDKVVWTDDESGAETRLVSLRLRKRTKPLSYEQVASGGEATHFTRIAFFARNNDNNRVWAFTDAGTRTDKNGAIIAYYMQLGPLHRYSVEQSHIDHGTRWEVMTDPAEIQPAWDDYVKTLPDFMEEDLHLITGAILPIWDRLKGDTRVKRVATDDGERLLGRVIPDGELADTLMRLGASSAEEVWTTPNVRQRLLAGTHKFVLANGWTLYSRILRGDRTIIVDGPNFTHLPELKVIGIYYQRIHTVYFQVPCGVDHVTDDVLNKLFRNRPVSKAVRIAEEAAM